MALGKSFATKFSLKNSILIDTHRSPQALKVSHFLPQIHIAVFQVVSFCFQYFNLVPIFVEPANTEAIHPSYYYIRILTTALDSETRKNWGAAFKNAEVITVNLLLQLILEVTYNNLLCAKLALEVSNARTGMSSHMICDETVHFCLMVLLQQVQLQQEH